MSLVVLRDATPVDSEFCYRLHKASMGDYITQVWGWDERLQRGLHARSFNPHRWQIITVNGADVGMIDVQQRAGATYLARIEILPSCQGHGYGACLITDLIDDARRSGRDLELDVLAVNHRARSLYRRLGLIEMARHGDGEIKISMRFTRSASEYEI